MALVSFHVADFCIGEQFAQFSSSHLYASEIISLLPLKQVSGLVKLIVLVGFCFFLHPLD